MSAHATPRAPLPVALQGTPLARELAGLDRCVHCGFCLSACPTYLALEDENDSPRGRLVLMRALAEGTVPLDDPAVGTHLDRCLGCRGCETACPSGVPYGTLLEATRATVSRARALPPVAPLVLRVFATAALRRPLLFVARLVRGSGLAAWLAQLPGRLGQPFAMLASTRPALPPARAPRPAPPATREPVALLEGCVMEGLFAHVHAATRTVLAANGHPEVRAPGQGCCGALHAHAGDEEGARALARANIAAFEASGAAVVVANSAGCGAMMKQYGHLLAGDAAWAARAAAFEGRVRDVSELLAAAGPAPGGAVPLAVTCDQPCHLQHAQRLVREPAAVLAAVPGLDVRPLADSDQCCGSAGIYNLLEPGVAAQVLAPKLAAIAATGATLVATGNPGCHMHIGGGLVRAGSGARVVHPVELLARSYAAPPA